MIAPRALSSEFVCVTFRKKRRCNECSGCRAFIDLMEKEFKRGTPVRRIAELAGAHHTSVATVKERYDATGVVCFKQGGVTPPVRTEREKVDLLAGAQLKCTRCHLRFHVAADCETELRFHEGAGCALGALI